MTKTTFHNTPIWKEEKKQTIDSRVRPIISEKRGIISYQKTCEKCGQVYDYTDFNGSTVCETCLVDVKLELFRPQSIDFQ